MESGHAAAAPGKKDKLGALHERESGIPGTVTELRSVKGILSPSIPLARM